jgi:4-amino-4-deoxy-L-arabinose transferase-like glycosyltransferase
MVLAATLLTMNVGTPFWSLHEDNAVVFTGIASNHLRLGLAETKGQDVYAETEFGHAPSFTQVPDIMQRLFHEDTTPQPYGDHPALLGLTIAGAIAVFGEHTAVVRAVPITYSLLAVVMFYVLMVRLFDRGIARFAALLATTFPVFAYFGHNVAHEAPTLFFGLTLIWTYLRWREEGGSQRRWWAVGMVASVVLGASYGWPMHYLAALLVGFDWLSRRRFDWRLLLLMGIPAVTVFVATILQIGWVYGDYSRLWAYFLLRTGSSGPEPSAAEWFRQIVNYMLHHGFGLIFVLLAPFAVAFIAYRTFRERVSQRTMVVGLLGAWGLAHNLIFRHGAWEHPYWQFYLVPFVAIAFAWPAVELTRRYVRPQWLRAVAFVMVGATLLAVNMDRILSWFQMNATGGEIPVRTLWQTLLE